KKKESMMRRVEIFFSIFPIGSIQMFLQVLKMWK
ncbi:unnamed protein product, partial [marine sediment metagenome]